MEMMDHLDPNIVKNYLTYKSHVAQQRYDDVENADAFLDNIEKELQECKSTKMLVERPNYLLQENTL